MERSTAETQKRLRFFVTGATGFIGLQVTRQLVAAGHHVVALVRNPAKANPLAAMGVTVSEGDITDRDSLRAPMSGADGVFHIAAWYKIGTRDKSAAERTNVDGTRNVLETMRELGIPKGVYTSTVAVFSDTHGKLVDESYRFDGPHLSEYDRTKWRAHYEVAVPLARDGLPLVIVQPGVVYGPGDTSAIGTAMKQYLQGKLPSLPKQTAFCWSHVDDVARGHILAMEQGRVGESYILAGPRHSFVEAFAIAEQVTGVKAPRIQLAPGVLRVLSKVTRLLERFLPVPPTYASESLRVVAGVTYLGDNSKAKRELGYTVRPLVEGFRFLAPHAPTKR